MRKKNNIKKNSQNHQYNVKKMYEIKHPKFEESYSQNISWKQSTIYRLTYRSRLVYLAFLSLELFNMYQAILVPCLSLRLAK